MGQFDHDYKNSWAHLAETGDAEALFQLGLQVATDDNGVDLIEAHKWFNLAAVAGNDQARIERANLAAEMTESEIAEAQREARKWKDRYMI